MGFDWQAYPDLPSLLKHLQAHKETCLRNRACPECGNYVTMGIGTGRLADGIFAICAATHDSKILRVESFIRRT